MDQRFEQPTCEFRWLNPSHDHWHGRECNGILEQKWKVPDGEWARWVGAWKYEWRPVPTANQSDLPQ